MSAIENRLPRNAHITKLEDRRYTPMIEQRIDDKAEHESPDTIKKGTQTLPPADLKKTAHKHHPCCQGKQQRMPDQQYEHKGSYIISQYDDRVAFGK